MIGRTVLLTVFALVLQAQDTAGVKLLLTEINEAYRKSDLPAMAALFAPGGELRYGTRILGADPEQIAKELQPARKQWSETTPPYLGDETIRFLSPELALIDVNQIQFGSMLLKRSIPYLLIAKRDGDRWKVLSMRFAGCQTSAILN